MKVSLTVIGLYLVAWAAMEYGNLWSNHVAAPLMLAVFAGGATLIYAD